MFLESKNKTKLWLCETQEMSWWLFLSLWRNFTEVTHKYCIVKYDKTNNPPPPPIVNVVNYMNYM